MADNQNTQAAIPEVAVNTENFKCPNCGATMTFDIRSQKFMCKACKTVKDIVPFSNEVKEHDINQYAQREATVKPFQGVAVASCANCGAKISFTEFQFSGKCPMCSSSQFSEDKRKSTLPADGIIPFKVDDQEAQRLFRQWVGKRWFAPNDFKKSYGEGGLVGMFLPFWTYDASVTSNYSGLGGRTRIVRDSEGNQRTTIDWYPVAGRVSSNFDDVLICASDKESLVSKVQPYGTTRNALPYANEYLSGYYGEIYEVKADHGFQTAKIIMDNTMHQLAERDILMSYDQAQVHSINSQYFNVTYKSVLLPLWASTFGYKGRTFNYLINGETGKVTGSRPYSAPKIIAAVIAGIILTIVLYYVYMYFDGGGSYEYSAGGGYESYDSSYDNNNYYGEGEDFFSDDQL